MAKRRNRRRFYPEFYTDEELKRRENVSAGVGAGENTEKNENINNINIEESMQEAMDEVMEIIEERTYETEIPAVPQHSEFEPEPENELNNEIKIEIPAHMYIKEMTDEENIPENPEKAENEPDIPVFAEMPPQLPVSENENIETETKPEIEIAPTPGIISFDREKAIEYAKRWALDRNPDYYNFEELAGDCTNYISQILLAGGCKMDKSSPVNGWYYNNANDKSHSWTGVEQLYDYLVRDKERGIIAAEIDLNEVEAGDIVQLSFNGKTFQHTPFIIDSKRAPSGEVSYDTIKICAHSFDSENRSLDTYQWKKIRFIRILGYK